jgi:hypothetical protein
MSASRNEYEHRVRPFMLNTPWYKLVPPDVVAKLAKTAASPRVHVRVLAQNNTVRVASGNHDNFFVLKCSLWQRNRPQAAVFCAMSKRPVHATAKGIDAASHGQDDRKVPAAGDHQDWLGVKRAAREARECVLLSAISQAQLPCPTQSTDVQVTCIGDHGGKVIASGDLPYGTRLRRAQSPAPRRKAAHGVTRAQLPGFVGARSKKRTIRGHGYGMRHGARKHGSRAREHVVNGFN